MPPASAGGTKVSILPPASTTEATHERGLPRLSLRGKGQQQRYHQLKLVAKKRRRTQHRTHETTVGEAMLRSYHALGLANTRDGKPKKGWHLLREFAGHEGVYDAAHPSGLYPPTRRARPGTPALSAFSEQLGPALSDLGEHLQQLFPGIPGKPFAHYDARRHQYRAIIQLSWEPGYRQRKAQE